MNPLSRKAEGSFMPLGLLSIASTLKDTKNKVKVYEPKIPLLHGKDYNKTALDILRYKPDIIGFSTWCITYPAVLLIAKEIKALIPEVPIIFGGPQASLLATETMKNFPYVDFVLSGEADFTFPKLIKELKKPSPDFSDISGLNYRDNSGVVKKNRISLPDMDKLPIPAYHLIPRLNWMKLDVGRGCPFTCTYCSTNEFFTKKYRVKSTDRIINEMMLAFCNRNIKSFSFAHDMFTLNKQFVFELCNKLIAIKETRGISFHWTCSSRIDCITEKMLLKMKAAGCKSIFFGIETGSIRMQKVISKNLDISKAFTIADICRSVGIDMHTSFIIGFPEETPEELNETLKCALGLAKKGALTQVSELTLLPGTSIYNSHHNELKFDGNFSNFSRNLCGKEEHNLIQNFPDIFSSFYYLPVQAIQRSEMLYLRLVINNSKHFRNTIFTLSSFFEDQITKMNLLKLFKNEFHKTKNKVKQKRNLPIHWINIIDEYLIKNEIRNKNPYIHDIFTFESYSALLKLIYIKRHLNYKKTKNIKLNKQCIIKPTPDWKIISTSYKLEKILPSENNWKIKPIKVRKGHFTYLVIAISAIKCKKIRLNQNEIFLLEQLSELSFQNYVKRVKSVLSKEETTKWINKLKRLGVLDFIEPQ